VCCVYGKPESFSPCDFGFVFSLANIDLRIAGRKRHDECDSVENYGTELLAGSVYGFTVDV
jgi:hypothetical protein